MGGKAIGDKSAMEIQGQPLARGIDRDMEDELTPVPRAPLALVPTTPNAMPAERFRASSRSLAAG